MGIGKDDLLLALRQCGGSATSVELAQRIGYKNGRTVASMLNFLATSGEVIMLRAKQSPTRWMIGQPPQESATRRGKCYHLTDVSRPASDTCKPY